MNTISILDLANVIGGAAGNTGITGGIPGINNKVPPMVQSGNTGITGGIPGINNKVPPMVFPSGNTGITGGIHGINNKVPSFR